MTTDDHRHPPLLSLKALVRRSRPADARSWFPTVVAVGFLLLLGLVSAWSAAGPMSLVVLLVSAAVLVPLWSVERLDPLWRRAGEYVVITAIGAFTLTTGGHGSPSQHLLLLPAAYGMAAQPTRARGLSVVAYALAWLWGPDVVTGSPVPWADLATETMVLVTMAAAVWLVRVTVNRSRRRLDTAEALRQTLVEGHTDAVFILSPEGTFLEANEATAKLTGRSLPQLLGRSFVPLIPEDVRAETMERFQRALAGEAQTYETAVLTGDGHRVDLFVTNVRISHGDVLGVYGIASDVSGRVRDRRRLEASERRFRTLAESLQEGVYIIRTAGDHRVEFVNAALGRMTGLPPEQLTSLGPFASRVHEADRGRFRQRATSPRALHEPFRLRYVRDDGRVRWLELRESPLLDADGDEIGVQGTMRDITAEMDLQRSTEAALAAEHEAVEHLRRVDDMKNSFLQSVSHELRTPLTSILGFTQTIRDHGEALGPERVRHLLDRTIVNAGKLDRMLGDLLDVDRMSRGVLTVNRAPVALHALVAEVLDEVGVELALTIVPDLQPATASLDAPKVERIVENLVTNADRHATEATRVWVSTAPCHDGAMLTVADDGPGVPVALRERIFEPFFQGTGALQAASPGTGVGLALVTRFTELHGGSVEVDERPGGGARFVVRFCEDRSHERAPGAAQR